MALSDIFKRNNVVNENATGWIYDYGFGSPKVGKYSDIYFHSLIKKIFGGLSNVRYTNNGKYVELDVLADFLTDHISELVWLGWRDGYVVLEEENGRYSIVWNGTKKDTYGRILIPNGKVWHVFYTLTYTLKRVSDFEVVKEQLCFIDRLASALDYLTSTYGSVGIISGKTMPMNVSDKEELNNQLQESLGITRNKRQFIISRGTDFDIKQFSFDLQGLDLEGKLKAQYLLLADYFNVPKNILTTDVDSTYENQNAALKRFYTDCITPLVEWVLAFGRKIIIDSDALVPSTDLSYVFDNVEVLDQDRNTIEYIKSLTDIISSTGDEEIKRMLEERIKDKIIDWQ